MKKKIAISVTFDTEKLKALNKFAARKGINLDAEFAEFFEKKYRKIVPKEVQKYIDEDDQIAVTPKGETLTPTEFEPETKDEAAILGTTVVENAAARSYDPSEFWSGSDYK